jgi:hypothetical protein
MKPGPKSKDVCSKGHIIAEVGRTKSGNCKKCKQEYSKIRQQFIKDNFKI